MYYIFLGIIGLFVVAGLFDRSMLGLALLMTFAMLVVLTWKTRRLDKQVRDMAAELDRLWQRQGVERPSARREAEAPAAADETTSAAAAEETVAPRSWAPPADVEAPPQPAATDTSAAEEETRAGPAVPPAAAARTMPPLETARRAASPSSGEQAQRSRQTPPPPPRRHNWFDRMLQKAVDLAWSWITGGNIFVRVGIIILFMGMTFLIRYAIGQNLVPLELRLAIVGAVAVALLAWGWRQRQRKQNFALVVQGGGIGLLYLTIFASFSLYHVLDSTPAFVMLGIIVILAAIMAIKQDAVSLALFAAVGGFLAPILTSSGSNNYIGLFSYYTILNLGIFTVAWFRSWRILNLTGFVFTFAISGTWGVLSYEPQFYQTTQPFLVIFFLLYVGVSVLFALRRSLDFRDTIDSSLVFGTPLLAFIMQYELVGDFEYGIATSAFTMAAFYLCLAYILWRRFSSRLALLVETFVSLAVIFATLAIPFAIDGSLTGSIWAIEGAGILWVSVRQQQFYRRLFAVLLMLGAGAITAWEILVSGGNLFVDKSAFVNSAFISSVLIAVASAIGSWLLSSPFTGRRALESKIEYGLLGYSSIVLLAGFAIQVLQYRLFSEQGHLLALLAAATGLAYVISARRLQWKNANWMALGFFALLLPAAAISYIELPRLGEHHGYLLWPAAMLALFHGLRHIRGVLPGLFAAITHCIAAGLLALLLLWEGVWQLLLGFALLAILFCELGRRYDWRELSRGSILFLPVMVLCFLVATALDGDLVTLSSIGAQYYPPLPPGGILWPLALAAYYYLLRKHADLGGRFILHFYLGGALLITAMLLWMGLWTLLLGATALCWLAYYLAWRYRWAEMRVLSKLLLPLMVLVSVLVVASGESDPLRLQPFNLAFALAEQPGFVLWPLAFVTLYLVYWLSEKENNPPTGAAHGLTVLFLVAMTTWVISRLAQDLVPFLNAWHLVLLPIAGMFAIKSIVHAEGWPFQRYREGFETYALPPLALGTLAWSLLQFASSGRDAPLVWLPLLNPLDAMQCLILFVWVKYGRQRLVERLAIPDQLLAFALAGYVFMWINVDILRFVHHWGGIGWDFSRLIQADLTQTLMSLVWSLLGLAGTFYAARIGQRQMWIAAALLLAVVVLKLFVVDLSAQDTIERIVSFTGVGILLTFVGYFSPIPPREKLKSAEQ